MARLDDNYTRYPRPILWLVRGGQLGEQAVEPFYLSKRPVTNVQFEAHDSGFVRAESAPGDDDAATGVSFEAAHAYCKWYAEVSRKPMRLPTAVEWGWACGADRPAVNPFGLLEMLDGVREWVVAADATGTLCGGGDVADTETGFRLARSLQ